jgi:hypothetical protein
MGNRIKKVTGVRKNVIREISSSPLRREGAYGGFYNLPVAGLTDEQQEVRGVVSSTVSVRDLK